MNGTILHSVLPMPPDRKLTALPCYKPIFLVEKEFLKGWLKTDPSEVKHWSKEEDEEEEEDLWLTLIDCVVIISELQLAASSTSSGHLYTGTALHSL